MLTRLRIYLYRKNSWMFPLTYPKLWGQVFTFFKQSDMSDLNADYFKERAKWKKGIRCYRIGWVEYGD